MLVDDGQDDGYGSTLLAEFKGLAEKQAVQVDRIVGRAQQIVLFVAAVFAIAQTAAISNINSGRIPTDAKHWIFGLAFAAIVFLGLAGLCGLATGSLRKYNVVGVDEIQAAADKADDDDVDVALILARRYQTQVKNGGEPSPRSAAGLARLRSRGGFRSSSSLPRSRQL
jgi:hypothetical protein